MTKIEPLIVIGSKQANAYIGSVNLWCSCITAACGMGGGQIPMIIELGYEDNGQNQFPNSI